MPKREQKPLGRALREERQRLAGQAYPGDLAREVLPLQPKTSPLHVLRYPALATAILGIGVVIVIALTQPDHKQDNDPGLTAQPTPPAEQEGVTTVAEQTAPESAPTPDRPAQPTPVQATAQKLPEIDRDLLPLKRNSQTTWLAGPTRHTEQLGRHTRLAEHPDPNKRVRLSLSAPTRRSIDRTFARTLTLKPSLKSQGTPNESA